MNGVERIEKNGIPYALIFRRDLPLDGEIGFATQDGDGLQVGFFERKAGYEVPPHRHLPRKVDLEHIAEFISVESGSMGVKVFDEAWNVIGETTIKAGGCVIFLRGGHAITMLEPTRIMEVKQGPYPGKDKDKVLRDAA